VTVTPVSAARRLVLPGLVLLAAFKVYEVITPHLFAIPVLLAAYVLFVAVKPEKRCGRCNGWGKRGRRSACSRCDGTGLRFRLGAPLVHRGMALAIKYARERRENGS
jgi:hypothetical protein